MLNFDYSKLTPLTVETGAEELIFLAVEAARQKFCKCSVISEHRSASPQGGLETIVFSDESIDYVAVINHDNLTAMLYKCDEDYALQLKSESEADVDNIASQSG